MDQNPNISKSTATLDKLEYELYLKQIQMNSLLAITQAINGNIKEESLFNMYRSFLVWDLGVPRMALCIKRETGWQLAIEKGAPTCDDRGRAIENILPKYYELSRIIKGDHPFLDSFDYIIPVRHKDTPIACAFIEGLDKDGAYSKLQFITAITNIVSVAIENKRLFRAKIEQQVIERELKLASEIQTMLVPKQLPKNDQYHLAQIYRQHFKVGGDYYDYFHLDDNRFAFCVADISGKGIGAAMLMANFQASLRGLIFRSPDLNDLVSQLNEAIFNLTGGDRFITFFIAINNLETGELEYINAGHIPPLFVQNNKVKLLQSGCMLLGITEHLPVINVGYEDTSDPSIIFTFTDGVTDIKNPSNEYLSNHLLESFSLDHAHLPPDEFNAALFNFMLEFKDSTPFPDDITVLTCKIF